MTLESGLRAALFIDGRSFHHAFLYHLRQAAIGWLVALVSALGLCASGALASQLPWPSPSSFE